MKATTCTQVLKLSLLVLLFIAAPACKKDKKSSPENFLNAYLEQSGFNQKSTDITATSEFGLFFSPAKPGSINKVYVKTPKVQNNIRVTIWEVATKKILFSQLINASTANTFFSADVTGLSVIQDVEYAITINTASFYQRKKTDNSNATYPFTCGNIKILSYKWGTGTTEVLPANVALNYYGGDMSFDFLPND